MEQPPSSHVEKKKFLEQKAEKVLSTFQPEARERFWRSNFTLVLDLDHRDEDSKKKFSLKAFSLGGEQRKIRDRSGAALELLLWLVYWHVGHALKDPAGKALVSIQEVSRLPKWEGVRNKKQNDLTQHCKRIVLQHLNALHWWMEGVDFRGANDRDLMNLCLVEIHGQDAFSIRKELRNDADFFDKVDVSFGLNFKLIESVDIQKVGCVTPVEKLAALKACLDAPTDESSLSKEEGNISKWQDDWLNHLMLANFHLDIGDPESCLKLIRAAEDAYGDEARDFLDGLACLKVLALFQAGQFTEALLASDGLPDADFFEFHAPHLLWAFLHCQFLILLDPGKTEIVQEIHAQILEALKPADALPVMERVKLWLLQARIEARVGSDQADVGSTIEKARHLCFSSGNPVGVQLTWTAEALLCYEQAMRFAQHKARLLERILECAERAWQWLRVLQVRVLDHRLLHVLCESYHHRNAPGDRQKLQELTDQLRSCTSNWGRLRGLAMSLVAGLGSPLEREKWISDLKSLMAHQDFRSLSKERMYLQLTLEVKALKRILGEPLGLLMPEGEP